MGLLKLEAEVLATDICVLTALPSLKNINSTFLNTAELTWRLTNIQNPRLIRWRLFTKMLIM